MAIDTSREWSNGYAVAIWCVYECTESNLGNIN